MSSQEATAEFKLSLAKSTTLSEDWWTVVTWFQAERFSPPDQQVSSWQRWMAARVPKPVENRSCHLENDRAILSPSRLALHLWPSGALLASLVPANLRQEGRVPFFFFWEAQNLQPLQGIDHKWGHTVSCKACSASYQLIERTIQYISKDIHLFALGAHQSSKGVETRVGRLAYPALHSELSCRQAPDHGITSSDTPL